MGGVESAESDPTQRQRSFSDPEGLRRSTSTIPAGSSLYNFVAYNLGLTQPLGPKRSEPAPAKDSQTPKKTSGTDEADKFSTWTRRPRPKKSSQTNGKALTSLYTSQDIEQNKRDKGTGEEINGTTEITGTETTAVTDTESEQTETDMQLLRNANFSFRRSKKKETKNVHLRTDTTKKNKKRLTRTKVKNNGSVPGRHQNGRFILKRFSFMDRSQTNIFKDTSAPVPLFLPTRREIMYDNDESVRNRSRIFVLDSLEIRELADCSVEELNTFEYHLHQWEQIYRQLSTMYEKVLKAKNKTKTNKDEIKVPKWTLERALDKVSKCIENHPEYKRRQRIKLEQWEKDNRPKNLKALTEMKNIVPPEIKELSVQDLVDLYDFSWPLARRLVQKKVFQLFYMSPDEIGRIYNSDFSMKGRFDYTGLDIVELRAVYAATDGIVAKWRTRLRDFLFDLTMKEANKTLGIHSQRHHSYSYKPGEDIDDQGRNFETANSERQAKKERLTSVLRSKTRSLFNELQGKDVARKRAVVDRVEKMAGGVPKKYTELIRRRLSLEDDDSDCESEHEYEDEKRARFDHFYRTGSFKGAPEQNRKSKRFSKERQLKGNKVADTSSHQFNEIDTDTQTNKKTNNCDSEEENSDLEEVENIGDLIQQLEELSSSPEELEKLLESVLR